MNAPLDATALPTASVRTELALATLEESAASSDRPMRRRVMWFLVRRITQAIPILIMVGVINFTLLNLAPGDFAQVLVGNAGGASADYLDQLRQSFGLDQPLWIRLVNYLARLARFDLGYSYSAHASVLALIGQRVTATLLLTGAALAMAVVLGVCGGFLSSLRPGGGLDRLLSAVAVIIYATPSFLLGLALIILFSVKLRWLPAGGLFDAIPPTTWSGALASLLAHLLLPAVTLALFFASIYLRVTRTAMLEVRGLDYVRTARAAGLPPLRVARRYVLRNALLPVVTIIGLQAGTLLGGAILVEVVFAWPGLGRLAFEAVFQRDYNLLSGVVLCGAVAVLAVNILVDLLYSWLDPRIDLQ
ncbi:MULTISPECIES: ABC transporter permease [Bradyrhizobium]|jgi:peptide/nickel transport system permease protein|uniref:ABC transporter permease n=5 Tax=Nitrobacteraceae TaxID=41294 RepID=UPI00039CF92D|nr:ABC transporter permease [Bradyrhizobium denitrificans]